MALGAQLQVAGGTQMALAILGDMADGLTATGTTQGTAYAITAANSIFTTVPAGSGAILPVTPTVSGGDRCHVANLGANNLYLWPPVGGTMNGGAVNVGVAIGPNRTADFVCRDGTNYTALLSA